jgi:hypothetical protein
VGVSAIAGPASNFNLTNAEQISVVVSNYSTNPLTGFPVSYKIGSNPTVTETMNGVVPPFGTYTYTFSQTADLSVYQNYNVKAYTSLSGDVVTTNDTINKVISNFATGTNFGVNFDGLDDKIIINNAPQLRLKHGLMLLHGRIVFLMDLSLRKISMLQTEGIFYVVEIMEALNS